MNFSSGVPFRPPPAFRWPGLVAEYSQTTGAPQLFWTPGGTSRFRSTNHIRSTLCWKVAVMRYLDLGVILAYLAGITWFGARFRRNQKSLRDYLLGGRNAPWWAISLSIVSAETSTLTIVGTPA